MRSLTSRRWTDLSSSSSSSSFLSPSRVKTISLSFKSDSRSCFRPCSDASANESSAPQRQGKPDDCGGGDETPGPWIVTKERKQQDRPQDQRRRAGQHDPGQPGAAIG